MTANTKTHYQHQYLLDRVVDETKLKLKNTRWPWAWVLHDFTDEVTNWGILVTVELAKELAAMARLVILLELAEAGRVKVRDGMVLLDGEEVKTR